ncbi:hypothetical protein ACHQM5_000056 [Ranunculus cassubicifolius]
MSTLSVATSINVWTGVVLMLPIVGALLADSYLGRYRMILLSSILYTLCLGLLTLSTLLGNEKSNLDSDNLPSSQVIIFFISLYVVAIGQAWQDRVCRLLEPINLMYKTQRRARP